MIIEYKEEEEKRDGFKSKPRDKLKEKKPCNHEQRQRCHNQKPECVFNAISDVINQQLICFEFSQWYIQFCIQAKSIVLLRAIFYKDIGISSLISKMYLEICRDILRIIFILLIYFLCLEVNACLGNGLLGIISLQS